MYFYKKLDEDNFTLFQSLIEPTNKEGLEELTENEYAELLETLEEVE